MRLAYLSLAGFRGYTDPVQITFGDGFTIVDGRNGVGKSTISDAIEFALTGTISKYQNAKSDSESVLDYIWWRGEEMPRPKDAYVEVGFVSEEGLLTVKRERHGREPVAELQALTDRLCVSSLAPHLPLRQLCAATIIRDELIADLSLDLKDTERYSLIRDAIGATDADFWIEQATSLHKVSRTRLTAAQEEADRAATAIEVAQVRADELRASLSDDTAVSGALNRLGAAVGERALRDQILTFARNFIADEEVRIERLLGLLNAWNLVESLRSGMETLEANVRTAAEALGTLARRAEILRMEVAQGENASALATRARDLATLAELGHRLGLHDESCPLCAAKRNQAEFSAGLRVASDLATKLDADAAARGRMEAELASVERELLQATDNLGKVNFDLVGAKERLQRFDAQIADLGLPSEITRDQLQGLTESAQTQVLALRNDLRVAQSVEAIPLIERADTSIGVAVSRQKKAEESLGRARRGEQRAQAILDAARRAAAETLDQRLARVLPLMSELYQRLRPHPVWDDIEYRIRGDVRRFLRLQVGGELNPQFMFSSGQRRATGLAFLLSVNLALVWSKWDTIILDDPVQHIDDFRSVHLAEVLAQLVAAGRQLVVSVEDPALADFLSRRLPTPSIGCGKRITLGPQPNGALSLLEERTIAPMPSGTLVAAAAE